jgi:hypothetical protein
VRRASPCAVRLGVNPDNADQLTVKLDRPRRVAEQQTTFEVAQLRGPGEGIASHGDIVVAKDDERPLEIDEE